MKNLPTKEFELLAALFFVTYESIKSLILSNTSNDYAPFVHMGAASFAEMVSKIIFLDKKKKNLVLCRVNIEKMFTFLLPIFAS